MAKTPSELEKEKSAERLSREASRAEGEKQALDFESWSRGARSRPRRVFLG